MRVPAAMLRGHGAPRFILYVGMDALAGWLAQRTKGLAAPIVLHAVNNAAYVMCAAYLT